VSSVLAFVTRDLSLKVVALVFAVLFWAVAVLDRTYSTKITVPVSVGRSESKQVIPDIDVKTSQVTLEGRGRDLVGIKTRQLEFRLPVPAGKPGTRQVKLSPADLKLPLNVAVRAINPENVELRLNPAAGRSFAVQVPTTGHPAGIAVSVRPLGSPVRLLGTEEDLRQVSALYTDTLDLAGVAESGTRRLRVLTPEGGPFSVDPQSVDVAVEFEKEAARIFLGIPVKAAAGGTRAVTIDPPDAQIAVAGPASRIGSLKPSDIAAQVKTAGLGPGDYQLAAEFSLPPDFHLVKCEPQLFDVTVK
jgi:YbbR domain-containing protein